MTTRPDLETKRFVLQPSPSSPVTEPRKAKWQTLPSAEAWLILSPQSSAISGDAALTSKRSGQSLIGKAETRLNQKSSGIAEGFFLSISTETVPLAFGLSTRSARVPVNSSRTDCRPAEGQI